MRAGLLMSALVGLAACGGGGGGGSAGPSTPAPTVTPPTPTAVGPAVGSAEYQLNWGVAGVKAEAGWQRGASGAGIVVGVVDSGVDPNQPDLIGRVSSASRDINAGRNQSIGTDQHATLVAGVIASNYNNSGSVGVAFGSTILSVRADNASGTFNGADLAASIDYAVANGARVINLSVGSGAGPTGPAFEGALQRAIAAGVVFAMAAGNDATDAAHWPSGYAVDPRYAGSIIAVGSLNAAGSLSSFSNRAGAAGGGFVAAPGEDVITNCNGVTCIRASGTSLAAPHVSGSLALVLAAYPNLSGRQAVDLLFRTARDLGAPGNDPVYGWGAVDLARAFAPAGTLSIPVGTTVVSESLQPGSAVGAAFGDAIRQGAALRTVGWDYYQRPFETDLARVYGAMRPSILSPVSSDLGRRSDMALSLGGGASLHLAAAVAGPSAENAAGRLPWISSEPAQDLSVAYRKGRLGLAAWSGKSTGNPFVTERPDAFTALAQSDRAVRAEYDLGRWRLSAEAGAGQRTSVDLMEREEGARYGRLSGRTERGGVVSVVSVGVLSERMGPLGAYLPWDSGLALPSRTAFASWNAVWPLGRQFQLETQTSIGRTTLRGAVMRLEEAAWSTAWKATLRGPCAGLRLVCSEMRLSLGQPLRVESGRFAARLADPLPSYFAPVTYSDRRFGAAPSGRQIDLSAGISGRAPFDGVLSLDAVASSQPGHRRDDQAAYGLIATWRAGY